MRPRSLVVLVLGLYLSLAALGAPKQDRAKNAWRPAQVIVKYAPGFVPETGKHGVKRAKKVFGAFKLKGKAKQHADARGLDRVYLLDLDRDDVDAAIALLRQQPGVVYAEPNWVIEFPAVPNDPSFATQWGLAKIGAPAAWETATSGTGVVVGVVDTGIDLTHPDLAANLWTNPGEIAGNNVDDDGNGFVDDVHGWDFYANDNDPNDTNGHGTLVAGVIGAAGNNATGVSGVVWSAKLAALRTGAGSGDIASAVQALEYANMMGFRITNNSWGWWEGGQSFLLNDVVATAEASGYLFIAAAGNESKNNDWLPTYPSHYDKPNVISVTATTSSDALASFANYGVTSVDLGAPGEAIDSTARGGTYQTVSGSSFAAPFVAGAAALYWTANPTATHAQVRDAILLASDPLPALQGKTVSGGRLNVANLFDAERIAPAAVGDLEVVAATHRSVTLRFTSSGDDGATGNAARYDVRVSTAPITDANWNDATPLTGAPIPHAPGTLETFTLHGLDASTSYFVALRVVDNARNASALSNVATFATARAAVVFEDNSEGGTRDWTVDGTDGNGGPALWHIDASYPMTTRHWSYQVAGTRTYDTGARNWGTLTSPEIDLTQATDARLRFRHYLWTERDYGYDMGRVRISSDGGPWTLLLERMFTEYDTIPQSIDLSAYDGHRVRIRFEFDTIDATLNGYDGWQVDDVIVDAASANAPPVVDSNFPAVTEEVAATLTASGSDPEGAALEYKWSFGDGTYAYTRSATVSHTWTTSGTFDVTLVAYDGSNASDPVTRSVTVAPVNDRPVAVINMAFAPPPYLENAEIRITSFGSIDEEGSPLRCRFDYGDGGTITFPCDGSWTYAWQRPGTYTITLVVNDGELDSLPATQTITIEEASNDAPIARPGGPYAARPGVAVTLDGSASTDEETSVASYLWTFPDATTSTSATPAKTFSSSGAYDVSLVVTDQTGVASSAASTQVRVCGGASAQLFTNPVYTCPGGSAVVGINVTSGFLPMTLTWSDGSVQQITSLLNGYYAQRTVTPSSPTSYALASMTDFLDCAGVVSTAPTLVSFASATLPNNTYAICPGTTATLDPTLTGNGPWTLTWSDGYVQNVPSSGGGRTRTVSPTETTTYSIVSATCASCPAGTTALVSGSTTIEVTEPLSAVVSGGGRSCNGNGVPVTVTITGGVAPFTIMWQDGWQMTTSSRTATYSMYPSTTTTYTARVRSANCTVDATGSATIEVWRGTTPNVTVSGSTNICPGQPATITATVSGDGMPFTLTWSDGFLQTADTTTVTRVVTPTASTNYSVTSIVNTAGCSGTTSGSAVVTPTPPPTATVSGGGTSCSGGTARVRADFTGIGPFTITWSDGLTETISNSFTYRDVAPAATTTYTITSINDRRCSGTASGSATVVVSSPITVTVSGGGTSCSGAPVTIRATLSGGARPVTLVWSDGFTQQVTGDVATRDVAPTAPTTYTITSYSPAACGGSSTGAATVTPSTPVSVIVSGGGPACDGVTNVQASISGGTAPYTLVWSDGYTQSVSGMLATRQVYVTAATTFAVTSISPSACGSSISGSAPAYPVSRPSAYVSGGGSFCEGSSTTITAELSGTAPFTVTWSDGVTQTIASGTIATRTVAPAVATTYSVTMVTDAYCSSAGAFNATATPIKRPVITQQPQNKTITKGSTTTLTVTTTESGLNYQWYQGASGNTSAPVGTNSPSFTTPKLRSTTSYWVKIWKSSCAAFPTNSNTATVTVQ